DRSVAADRVGLALSLDMPDDALEHLRGLDVARVIDRRDIRRWLVLAYVVRDLVDEPRQPVDGQARALIGLALLLDGLGPLIAGQEVEVFQRNLAIRQLRLGGTLEAIAGAPQELLVVEIARVYGFRLRLRGAAVGVAGRDEFVVWRWSHRTWPRSRNASVSNASPIATRFTRAGIPTAATRNAMSARSNSTLSRV